MTDPEVGVVYDRWNQGDINLSPVLVLEVTADEVEYMLLAFGTVKRYPRDIVERMLSDHRQEKEFAEKRGVTWVRL